VPSADDVIELPLGDEARGVQVAPESVDVQTPPSPIATNLVPSADDATDRQYCDKPRGAHVAPESVEV
jgi:hypothetical protein